MSRRSENEDRVFEIIKRHRCHPVDLTKELSSIDYNHVVENSIQSAELHRRTGISKQTISDIIRRLEAEQKIITFRFRPNGEFLYEPYDSEKHKSTILRAAVSVHKKSFVGEDILNELGVRLVGAPETLNFFSASVSQQKVETNCFRLHFVAGGYLVSLVMNNAVFERVSNLPLTIFIGQSVRIFKENSIQVLKEENSSSKEVHGSFFLPEQSHLESLGENCVYLGIPDNSLFPPRYWPGSNKEFVNNPKLRRLVPRPSLGSLAITIYPDLKVAGLSVLGSPHISPKFCSLQNDLELLAKLLCFKLNLHAGVPWPNQPCGYGDGVQELSFAHINLYHGDGSTDFRVEEIPMSPFWINRLWPPSLVKKNWQVLEEQLLEYNRSDLEKLNIEESFIEAAHKKNELSSLDLIKSHFEAYTSEIRLPSVVNYRGFNLLLTSPIDPSCTLPNSNFTDIFPNESVVVF